SRLGYYTNFVNLLDLCGIAVPCGFRDDGLPAGVTLIAPAFGEDALAEVAALLHAAVGGPMGATGQPLRSRPPASVAEPRAGCVELAVVGAHLSGGVLNYQLTQRGATLLRTCRTAPIYRLYALTNTTPPKPGLKRTSDGGRSIEVEVWSLGLSGFGEFTAQVPPPLGIGTVELEDGAEVKGFICECHALEGAIDISHYGGWRAYLAHAPHQPERA
ncbi:MAG: allophanate hydrolase, partial [Usitatibacter sp.]